MHYIAPSFKRVGVCAQRALLSVFRQTDSWSNRLRRAVGSLGYDLSPLGPLHSSLVNSKFKTILIVLWLGGYQVEHRVYLSKRGSEIFSVTREGNRYSEEIRKAFSCSALCQSV